MVGAELPVRPVEVDSPFVGQHPASVEVQALLLLPLRRQPVMLLHRTL